MPQPIAITKTVADTYPDGVKRLRAEGFPAIARMAELMPTTTAIDRALGFSGAASHWFSGRNGCSKSAERAAMMWLETRGQNNLMPEHVKEEPKAQPQADDTAVLMVVCPRGKADKAIKVLGLMGCEVEEI